MTKADLVTEIAKRTSLEKTLTQVVVEELMSVIKEHLTAGENIYLRGFGTFEIIERKEKTARNITKGETIIVPAHKIPKFKPAKEFKDSIR